MAARAGLFIDGTRVVLSVTGAHETEHAITTAADVPAAISKLLGQADHFDDITAVLGWPFATTRVVSMPAMPRATAEQILSRDWERYAIGAVQTKHAASARPIGRDKWAAAFAPLQLLDDIVAACAPAKVRITSTDALLASRASAKSQALILVRGEDRWHVTLAESGLPLAGRDLLNASEVDLSAFVREHRAESSTQQVLNGAEAARIIASAATHASPNLVFESATARHIATATDRRVTRWLWAAVLVAVVGAMLLENAVLSRRERGIAAQRASIASQVAGALAQRDTLQLRADALAELAARESNASRVSGMLAALAVVLPQGTSLASVQLTGDTLLVEGDAARADAVFGALRGMRELERVKLAAPRRQDVDATDPLRKREHFAFAAHVRQPR